MLPFTQEQFLAVFATYNQGIWPAQVLAYLLGVGMVVQLFRPSPGGDRLIGAGLAAMWAWTGIAYHWLHFSAINRAALLFGALFVLQALLLFHAAVIKGSLRFGIRGGLAAWVGWSFVIYAAVLYPLIGIATGHGYPQLPMFGVTPCPVTIFTFGMLLLTSAPVPWRLLAVPLVWSLIGGSAAFLLKVPQDWLLLVSGSAILLLRHRARGEVRPASAA